CRTDLQRKSMHARGRPAGDLEVDLRLPQVLDEGAADLLDFLHRLRKRNLDPLHALLEARQVLRQPERLAPVDADDLVNAVAELEAAVLHGDAPLLERQ